MSLPTQDTAHVAEAQALLTDHFRTKVNVNRILTALTSPVQDLENAAWDMLQKRLLNGDAAGVVLDWYGKLVGMPRGALSDANYLTAIKIAILANRSSGRAEDVVQVATALANLMGSAPAGYLEGYTAGFLVEIWNVSALDVVTNLLKRTRDPGVYAVLHYSSWPASGVLRFSSRYDATTGNGVYSSRYGGVSNAGSLCAASIT